MGGEFLRGEVGVLRDLPPPGDLPLLVQLVVSEDVVVVGQEDLPPLVELLRAPIVLLESLGELQEGDLGGQGDSDNGEENSQ